MKSRSLAFIIAALVFTRLAAPIRLDAQEHHYKLIGLGTFGGPDSYVGEPALGNSTILNNVGALAGWADTSKPDPYQNFALPTTAVSRGHFNGKTAFGPNFQDLPGA